MTRLTPVSRRFAPALAMVAVVAVALTLTGCVQKLKAAPGGSVAISRSTAVPAPDGGSVNQVVPTQKPGAVTETVLGKAAALPSKVTITIVSTKLANVKAITPGEIQGPAVEATVKVHNGTAKTIDLGSTVVDLTEKGGALGQPTTSRPASPFTQKLAPGKSLTGVYVFRVPASGFNPIHISVSYAGGAPSALFAGSVSK